MVPKSQASDSAPRPGRLTCPRPSVWLASPRASRVSLAHPHLLSLARGLGCPLAFSGEPAWEPCACLPGGPYGPRALCVSLNPETGPGSQRHHTRPILGVSQGCRVRHTWLNPNPPKLTSLCDFGGHLPFPIWKTRSWPGQWFSALSSNRTLLYCLLYTLEMKLVDNGTRRHHSS